MILQLKNVCDRSELASTISVQVQWFYVYVVVKVQELWKPTVRRIAVRVQ